ncbi:MAG TPA: AMP-binding protein [Desulfatiglandales bacterium]|nr:AMP-binding protein [Desulfatiglandales bacterium]
MTTLLEGFIPYKPEDAERYKQLGCWANLTFGDILDRAADRYPDKEAFVDSESRLTYAQARDTANRLGIGLMNLGINPTDRVLVQVPNWNEFVYTYFALQKIGAVNVLLIDRYRQYEINHLFRLTGATSWIVPEKYGKIDYLPIVGDVLEEHPQIKNVILVRGKEHEPYFSLEKLLADAELTDEDLARLAQTRPDPLQVAHMGPTGGTTGLPKIVPRTHNDLLCGSEYCARAWEMDAQDTCLLAGPLGHDLTFTKGLLASMLTYGKTVFLDSTDPEAICRTIEKERVTALVWVPTLAKRLVGFEGLGNYDLSSLKKMHCGGGASLPDLIKAVREKLGCTYFNAYGATEGQTTITRSNDDLETLYRTVGKPTCPHDIYKVVDRDGRELPHNTPGELLIKGPGVFTGYYKNPRENEEVFDKDGFFRTGDVAKIDEKGYITLTGRIKEMINRGGESISAVEIEKLISEHPGVALVAVIPMSDPEMGERVCAYVQPKPGTKLSFNAIISFLKDRKASVLQLPERIEFVDVMLFTKAEKIDKTALREDIERKLLNSSAAS